jgi:uncharacterized MAPEG superfamily protein
MPTLAPASVTELKLLGIAVLIGLLQLVWEALAAQSQRGFGWALGARDQKREVSGVPARLQRALHNYLETFPMFVAALLASILLGRTSPSTLIGAWLYVVGRAAYVPLYAAGVPMVRSLVWGLAMLGIVLEVVSIL